MPTMRAAEGQKLAEEHLALANRHITQAKERIARQQALIQRIAAAGWAEAGPGPRRCARGVSTSVYFRDPDDNLVEFTVYDR